MWHVIPVMIVMTTIGDRILHAGTGLMLVVGAACYAIIFVVSYVSYAYFETPARRWIDSWKLFATAAGAETGARAQPGRGEEIRPAER
jgi:peptidoglycan/LPS O-acetylase OafA/YrhL